MRDYLIDSNILGYWFNPNYKEHENVLKKASEIQEDSKIWISAITWGEIEYGYWCLKIKGQNSLEGEFRQFINRLKPIEYPIDKRARLFDNCPPKGKKKKKSPEQLIDPATSSELQIQENDLWIASQAITRNMVLVTNDKKSFKPLLKAVQDASENLIIDNWAE